MAELDLAQLSAPIEALRDEVKAAYIRLDAKWDAIAEKLRSLPIPGNVFHVYDSCDMSQQILTLEFRKWNGSKRICQVVEEFDGIEHVTPLEEWSAEERIRLLEYVPELFKEAEKKVREFIESTK